MTDSVTKKGCPKIHIDTSFLCEPVRSQEGERRKCMLIRSQDKTALVKFENIVVDLKLPDSLNVICWSLQDTQRSGGYFILGKYSTKEKTMKVLDMIQEAYGDSEYTKYVIPEVCRILSTKPKTEENKAHASELGEMLRKGMTFQMPADSEVVV